MDAQAQVIGLIADLQKQIAALPPSMQAALQKATYGLGGSPTDTQALTYYDLEEEAKVFVPEITPLAKRIPRVPGAGGIATHWDMVTSLNTSQFPMGVPTGKRAATMDVQSSRQVAAYATLGLEASLEFEQDLAARGQQDMQTFYVRNLLQAARIGEERVNLGGNADVALGTCPTPAVTPSNSGGVLTNAHGPYNIRCVALTLAAYRRASMTIGIPTTHVFTQAGPGGGSTTVNGGASQVSANATATIASGTTGSIAATVTAVFGAVAYAWFMGDDSTTNCNLAGITTVNAFTFTTNPAAPSVGTGFAGAVGANFGSDRSTNNLVYNGLLSFIAKAGSNSYLKSLDNAQLTTDDAGGCKELNDAFLAFWLNFNVSPQAMIMGAQPLVDLSTLVVKNGGAPLIRQLLDAKGQTPQAVTLTAGSVVGFYMNKTAQGGGQMVEVILHPDMPPGAILFYSDRISYPVPNVVNLIQIKTQEEWRMIEWPLVTREYQRGVYARQLMQVYFSPAFGGIFNIKPGVA